MTGVPGTVVQIVGAVSEGADSKVNPGAFVLHEITSDDPEWEMLALGGVNSKAPISLPSPPTALAMDDRSIGRRKPRSSVSRPALWPLSMAGLPDNNPIVGTVPPLSCNGPSKADSGAPVVPT